MMPRISEINCIILLLMQVCFISVTQANHDTVKLKIRTGTEIIELNWKRTEQYIANKNLPIWKAQKNKEPQLIPRIMEDIGDFITYHDVEQSSAAVYFVKSQRFYGVIDSRYYLLQVPLNDIDPNIYYDVDNQYIFAREQNANEEYFHDIPHNWLSNMFTDDQIELVNSIIDSTSNDIDMSSSSAQNTELVAYQNLQMDFAFIRDAESTILYPEILVFITNDIYNDFKGINENKCISLLVSYYIVYFNAINMLFAKLGAKNIEIHINIAGLVIETEPGALPYSIRPSTHPDGSTFYRFRERRFSINFQTYVKKYKNIFPEDSFDFFFVSTGYPMQKHGHPLHGVSSSKASVYTQRSVNRPYEFLLGSVIQRKKVFGDYVTATREIGHLMGIKNDIQAKGSLNDGKQCYAIMQKSKSHCQNCLNWSVSNRLDLTLYVRHNRNHCFLRNFPRSFNPYDQPMFSMNPEDQCLCYQFPIDTLDPFYIITIPEDSCNKPMRCSYNQDPQTFTPPPMDGTPCGSQNKVCWRGECVAAA